MKIVAIGGGENGRIKADGTRYPYELEPMDREIVRLTGKKEPNFLFIGHAQPLEWQDGYFKTMVDIYGKRFGCECKILRSDELDNKERVRELVEWADIIYEGGGNTKLMMERWRMTGFDKVLANTLEKDKVLCGVSAGANAWFSSGNSDIRGDSGNLFMEVSGLGFVRAYFVPHCDMEGRMEYAKRHLEHNGLVGIALSNRMAIEIVDNCYRLISSDNKAYGLRCYFDRDGNYHEDMIDSDVNFKNLRDLLIVDVDNTGTR